MNSISFRKIKHQVLQRYHNNWMDVIKANILPIVTAIMRGFVIASVFSIMMFFLTHQGVAVDGQTGGYTDPATNPVNNSGSNLSMEFLLNALVTFIAVGIQYGTLDWLRDPSLHPSWATPFKTFSRKYFTSTLAIYIFQFVFIFLWSMLFIIPGIIKFFSYSQAYLIYKDAERKGISHDYEFVNFITFSRKLMDGYKLKFFMLHLSLIGWYILSILTFGIGFIWLIPYQNGLYSAFYQELVNKRGAQVLPAIYAD